MRLHIQAMKKHPHFLCIRLAGSGRFLEQFMLTSWGNKNKQVLRILPCCCKLVSTFKHLIRLIIKKAQQDGNGRREWKWWGGEGEWENDDYDHDYNGGDDADDDDNDGDGNSDNDYDNDDDDWFMIMVWWWW